MKTLVISSNSPLEDAQAAAYISSAMVIERGLERVVWHSQLGQTIASLNGRMSGLEREMAQLKLHLDTSVEALSSKTAAVDKELSHLEERVASKRGKKAQNEPDSPD